MVQQSRIALSDVVVMAKVNEVFLDAMAKEFEGHEDQETFEAWAQSQRRFYRAAEAYLEGGFDPSVPAHPVVPDEFRHLSTLNPSLPPMPSISDEEASSLNGLGEF